MGFTVTVPNGGSDSANFYNFSGANLGQIVGTDLGGGVGTLTFKTNGSTALTLNSNQSATFSSNVTTGNVTTSNIVSSFLNVNVGTVGASNVVSALKIQSNDLVNANQGYGTSLDFYSGAEWTASIQGQNSSVRAGSGQLSFFVNVGNNNTSMLEVYRNVAAGSSAGGYHAWYCSPSNSSASEAMRLNSSGYLGIGKTSPSSYLDAYNDFSLKTGTFSSGSYVDIPIDNSPVVAFYVVRLWNTGNANLNYGAVVLTNTRYSGFGGGNGVNVINSIQGTTGTNGELASITYAISGSGYSLNLRISAGINSGSTTIGYSVRQIIV